MWGLDFISEEDFKLNIKKTVESYLNAMREVDLEDFNSNIIDPIKLLFDMKVYGKTTEELVEDEITRQIDKTNSNSIGYFNQNMFKYIKNCIVPPQGFDVIYTNSDNGKKIYAEMKNKHNTMNDGGKNTVMEKMQKTEIEPCMDDSLHSSVIQSSGGCHARWRYNFDHARRIR